MATVADQPNLLFFYSSRSGHSRRVESYLAQVLQRRSNHNTFQIRRIGTEAHPDLVDRFRIEIAPTLLVVENRKVQARLAPIKSAYQIKEFLGPWLR